METKQSMIEPLLDRVEEYGKTSIELLRLKFLNKTAIISSTLISRLILTVILLFFIGMLSVAAAFYLGKYYGENYIGFLLVTLFYGLIGILYLIIQPVIKKEITNSMIKQLFN